MSSTWTGLQPTTEQPSPVLPPPPPHPMPPPPPRAARRRVWPWVLLAIGATWMAVVGLLVVVGVLLGDDDADVSDNAADVSGTTATYQDDFAAGPGDFPVGERGTAVTEHRDGAYWIIGTESGYSSFATVPIAAADVVTVSATEELTTTASPGDGLGLVVMSSDDDGYLLEISSSYGAELIKAEARGTGEPALRLLATEPVEGLGGPAVLELTATWTESGTELVGHLDGVEVVRYTDIDGLDQFTAAGVDVYSEIAPVTMRVDTFAVRATG